MGQGLTEYSPGRTPAIQEDDPGIPVLLRQIFVVGAVPETGQMQRICVNLRDL